MDVTRGNAGPMRITSTMAAVLVLIGCAQAPAPAPAPCPPPPPLHFACDAAAFLHADAAQQTDAIVRWAEEWAAGKLGMDCAVQMRAP